MRKKLFTGLLAATLLCGCLFGLKTPQNSFSSAAEKYAVESQTDFSSLRYGSYFNLPQSVKIVVNENTKVTSTDGRLTFPDGIVYGSGTHLLNQTGEYTLSYYAEYNGKTIFAEEKFVISDKNWTVSSAKSSTVFGELTGFGATVKKDGADVSWADGKQGIRVSLAEGDTFNYNVPVNVYEMGNIVDLFKIYPNMRETAETDKDLQYTNTVNCSYVTVKLVDVYDSANYVEFLLWGDTISFYNSAGWSGQSPVGLEPCTCSGICVNAKKAEYEGARYHKHTITRYEKSRQWGVSTRAWTSKELVLKGGFNAQWDIATNRIYSKVENKSTLITDLDDSVLHDENIFPGFSTGEVFVEIQPQVYSGGGNIEIEIEELLGLSGNALNEALYVDSTAPVVEINARKTDDTGVYATKNVEISIPECTVRDLNFYGDLKANVYYNYGSSEQVVVYLKNGKFTPGQSGTYTLVYRATDSFGNTGYTTMQYNVIDEMPFVFEKEKLSGIEAGEWNKLPDLSVKGNNATPLVTPSVTDPKGNECKVENGSFFVEYTGEYTIVYEIKDNVYTEKYMYTVTTNSESGTHFYDEPMLPRCFVKDATYDIYALNAYTISEEGKTPHGSVVYVSVDGGEFIKLTEETKAEFVVAAKESVQFEYRFQNASKRSEKIPVIDVAYTAENKTYENYFTGNYAQLAKQSNQIDFCFNGSETTGKFEFISPLLFKGFTATFLVPKTLENYSSVTIQICDYANLKTENLIEYIKTAQGVSVSVNGGKAQKHKDTFEGSYTIQINGDEIILDSTARFSVNRFESRLCLLKISLGGITGESVISLKDLNGNRLREQTKETDLVIGYDSPVGTYKRGTTYTTSTALANGAFTICTESATKISVSKDGKIVNDINGKSIDRLPASVQYTFNLDEAGTYKIEYEAEVGKEKARVQAIVVVSDTIPPKITFENGLNETKYVKVKAGTEYTFASFTVSDNLTPADELIVTVFVRDYNFNTLQVGGTSITFMYRGYYVIQVYCTDADGNYATAYYYVLAE